jgi:PPIC-type PPIASE domain
MKLLREPLVHFLLLGAVLFGVFALVGDRGSARTGQIVVTPGHLEHLMVSFTRTWQRPPTAQELAGLIDDYIREEVLYREAVAMGLDRDDTIVRRRLRQKLEFLTEETAETAPPTEADLQVFLQQHLDTFRVEPRLAFRHVYLSRNRRSDATDTEARQLLAQLTTGGAATDTAALGDPFLLPPEFALLSRSEIARLFGDAFAQQLQHLEAGRWGGPIESGYGLHLVYVRERVDGRMPALAEVREGVQREWLAARRKAVNEQFYQRLRARYTVVVEQPQATSDHVPTGAAARTVTEVR